MVRQSMQPVIYVYMYICLYKYKYEYNMKEDGINIELTTSFYASDLFNTLYTEMPNGYKLPSPATLGELTQSQQQQILTHLFEPSKALFRHLVPVFNTGRYTSYSEFIESCRTTLLALVPTDIPSPLSSCDPDLLEIASTHPRLGVPKTTVLSDHSASEQKTLQADESVVKEFALLNREYEETFPGLRFVLFVNGRSKTEVKAAFRERIRRGNYVAELNDSLNAMCDIAIDRSGKLSSNL